MKLSNGASFEYVMLSGRLLCVCVCVGEWSRADHACFTQSLWRDNGLVDRWEGMCFEPLCV